SCSLSVLCWAAASVDGSANANVIIVSASTILAQFIASPLGLKNGSTKQSTCAERLYARASAWPTQSPPSSALSQNGDLLRCGISTRSMSQMGQSRLFYAIH